VSAPSAWRKFWDHFPSPSPIANGSSPPFLFYGKFLCFPFFSLRDTWTSSRTIFSVSSLRFVFLYLFHRGLDWALEGRDSPFPQSSPFDFFPFWKTPGSEPRRCGRGRCKTPTPLAEQSNLFSSFYLGFPGFIPATRKLSSVEGAHANEQNLPVSVRGKFHFPPPFGLLLKAPLSRHRVYAGPLLRDMDFLKNLCNFAPPL